MILSVMIYGILLGITLGGSALFLELSLRALGRPVRWIWGTAMVGTTLIPLVAILLPGRPENASPGGAVVPLEALYGLSAGASIQGVEAVPLLQALNRPLLLAWILASLLVLLLFSGTAVRLGRKSRMWARGLAGGENVLISDGLGPAVLGLFNPRIVLPPWALHLAKDELEIVLLHETEHRRARDPALLAGGILMVAAAPWNPALWWALGRLRLAVEGDCDGRVLARGVARKQYGRLLLGVASGARELFPLAPALAEGGGRFLERRLRMMETTVGRKRFGRAALSMAAGSLLLALACETPTPPQSGDGTVPEPTARAVSDPAGSPEAAWNSDGGIDPDGTLAGKAVLLERIGEDGTGSDEAGPPDGFLEGDPNPTEGVLIRIAEPPAGAKRVIEAMPLIIVDGVIFADGNAEAIIDDLNPDLIESIEVIKGGAAEALYGERAADGVIKITLKK